MNVRGINIFQRCFKDESKITKTILKLSEYGQIVDSEKLESDIAELIELYAFGTLKELEIGSLLHRTARVVEEHRLKGA